MEKHSSPGQLKGLSKLIPHFQQHPTGNAQGKSTRNKLSLAHTHRNPQVRGFLSQGSQLLSLHWMVLDRSMQHELSSANNCLLGPTLHLLPASLGTSLCVVWKQTSHSSNLPGASIWSSHTMRNNPLQISFSLPLPLMTKANFYDFHRSLQCPLLLIIANSSSSLPNFFTFKPTLLLWVLFSFLQLPPIPQLRVGVQEHRYQISVWFKQLPIYTCVGNLPVFYVAAVPKNTF